jgi:hypothetical protein
MTDDEAMREAGMTSGPKRKSKFVLRPMTALSLSWLQRNRVFEDDGGDMMQKTAAYAFLHTEPKEDIRAVVNNRQSFMDAVDQWLEKHITYHNELEPLSAEMSEAMDLYLVANTTAANKSDPGIPASKN